MGRGLELIAGRDLHHEGVAEVAAPLQVHVGAQSAQSLRQSAEANRALYEQTLTSAKEIRRLNEDLERRIKDLLNTRNV